MTTTETSTAQSVSDAVTAGSHATDIARSGAATFRTAGGGADAAVDGEVASVAVEGGGTEPDAARFLSARRVM